MTRLKLILFDYKSILIILWLVIAIGYFLRTPYNHRVHDVKGHINYTKFIVKKNHLPKPYQGWEAFQPPLYYLINSCIEPDSLKNGHIFPHVHYVRFLSIIYGAIAILLLISLLNDLSIPPSKQLLSLFFLFTTPKFVEMFSTYNNDSLATLFCVGIIVLSYKLYHKWSNALAVILLLIAIAGMYTKYSVIICALIVMLMCLKSVFKGQLSTPCKKLIFIMLIALLSLYPRLVLHNYKHTNKFFPQNVEVFMYKKLSFENAFKSLRSVIKIPFAQKKEWKHPWIDKIRIDGHKLKEPKQHDYFAFSFVSSVITKHITHAPSEAMIWFMLWVHFFVITFALRGVFSSSYTKLAFVLIVLAHLFHLFHCSQYKVAHIAGTMNFRYIAWSWVGWVVLYASSLSQKPFFSRLQVNFFVLGTLLHIYYLFTVTGGISHY